MSLFVFYHTDKVECPVELYFVIDTSETIALQENPPGSLVESIKEFTSRFAERLETVEYNGLVQITWTVGGLHFSMTQKMISSLTDKGDFIRKLKQVDYLGKGTFTDCAIERTTQEMRKTPPKERVQRFVVVITDGHVTGHPCGGIKMTAEAAREYAKIFVVASSRNLEETALREIANSPIGLYRSNYMAVNLTGARPVIVTDTVERIYDAMVMSLFEYLICGTSFCFRYYMTFT